MSRWSLLLFRSHVQRSRSNHSVAQYLLTPSLDQYQTWCRCCPQWEDDPYWFSGNMLKGQGQITLLNPVWFLIKSCLLSILVVDIDVGVVIGVGVVDCFVVNFSHFHLLLQNHWAISTKLDTKHPREKVIQVCSYEALFQGKIITNRWLYTCVHLF